MVSRRLSPLFRLDVLALNVIVSADKRLAAVSKLNRVRVLSSKKTLTTVLPRSAGTLGTGRALTSAIWSAMPSNAMISSVVRSSAERRCFMRLFLRLAVPM